MDIQEKSIIIRNLRANMVGRPAGLALMVLMKI
jgi:hypothetical protein